MQRSRLCSLSHFVHVRLTYTRRHCERSEAIQEKDRATECAMTDFCDDRFLCILPATCHRERRSLSAIYRLLRRVAPRNDGKCAALSLAALNNFVCKANETYVHSVRAMPQAAQQSFACFSLLVRFLFLLRNQKEKMNNNLHNLCMCSIDVHDMNYVKII